MSATVHALQSVVFGNHFLIGITALYFYDKVLTVQQEISLIWSWSKIGAVIPVAYGAMHINTTLFLLMGMCTPSNPSDEMVLVYTIVTQATLCALYLGCWGVISTLRVYAINGCKLFLPGLVLFLSSILPITANIYTATLQDLQDGPIDSVAANQLEISKETSKKLSISHTLSLCSLVLHNLAVEIVTRISTSLADTLILYATWHATGNARRLAQEWLNADVSIASLMLTDGTVFFCLILITNIIVITLFVSNLHNGSTASSFTFLTIVLTTISLSRLLLNLRGVAQQQSGTSASTSSLNFSQVIGPLGNSVDDGLSFHDADEDEMNGIEESERVEAGADEAGVSTISA